MMFWIEHFIDIRKEKWKLENVMNKIGEKAIQTYYHAAEKTGKMFSPTEYDYFFCFFK